MTKKFFFITLSFFAISLILGAAEKIQLPEAKLRDDVSLKQALTLRRTDRVFSSEPLSDQLLSDILWAANGINRPGKQKRTIPAARGIYAITLYIMRADGIYRHDLKSNTLIKVSSQDARSFSDSRKMGAKAPLVIVLAANKKAFGKSPSAATYIGVEAGAIVQNIHLLCAAYGLNAVVCGSFDRKNLPEALKLPAGYSPLLTQVIGGRP